MSSKNQITFTLALLSFATVSIAQTNTFPTTGNVGIGDASPSAKLSVNGYTPPVGSIWGANETMLFHNGSLGDNGSYGQWWKWNVYREGGTDNNRFLDFLDRPNAAELMLSEGGIRFRTTAYSGNAGDLITLNDRMTIKPTGEIGIGVYSPNAKLHLMTSGTSSDGFKGESDSGGWFKIAPRLYQGAYSALTRSGDSGFIFTAGSHNSGGFTLAPWGATEAGLRMDNLGNVGIGTPTPGNRLDVNGTIRAKEVIVETNWADYVFDPAYELKSLEEVGRHIQEHQRLPGMPSAEEVSDKGVSVGETQRLFLEKIEELTLYVIEIQKQNEAQSEEIVRLEQTLRSMRSANDQ